MPGRLWELIYAAAGRRFFFHFTNHLSDRQFYTVLWEQWLDVQTADTTIYVGASADVIRGFITGAIESSIASADGINDEQSPGLARRFYRLKVQP